MLKLKPMPLLKKYVKNIKLFTLLIFIILLTPNVVDACGRCSDDLNVWGSGNTEESTLPVTEEPDVIETPPPVNNAGPFWIVGNMWANIGISDTGYCPGYTQPASNSTTPPSLVWPLHSRNINPDRSYRITHPALDIYASVGDAVWAARSGRIIWAGVSSWCGAGCNVVAISHGNGWYSVYFHLSEVTVSCGQWVNTYGGIGKVGMTGSSNFEHLHFELRNGNLSYNPLPLLN